MLNKSLFLIVILSFQACSSEKDKKMTGDYSLDVENIISGSLSNTFSVTNAVLKISDKSFGTKLLVEVKRTANELPFDSKDAQVCGANSGKSYEWCITADILGENNIPIEKNLNKYGSDPFKKSISLQEGETIWLEFTISHRSALESNPNKVKLISSLEKQELSQISESNSSELEDNSSSNTPSNEDWDKVLDEYDDYVEKYIKFYKKAMAGDATAMSEYPALMLKAQSFTEKLQNASGDLSLDQTGRMMKIQTKMIEGLTK